MWKFFGNFKNFKSEEKHSIPRETVRSTHMICTCETGVCLTRHFLNLTTLLLCLNLIKVVVLQDCLRAFLHWLESLRRSFSASGLDTKGPVVREGLQLWLMTNEGYLWSQRISTVSKVLQILN